MFSADCSQDDFKNNTRAASTIFFNMTIFQMYASGGSDRLSDRAPAIRRDDFLREVSCDTALPGLLNLLGLIKHDVTGD